MLSCAAAAGLGGLTAAALGLSALYPLKAAALLLVLALIAGPALPRHPFPHVGPANAATMVRGIVVGLIAAFFGEDAAGHLEWIAPAAILAFAMDGLDGLLARKLDWESEFGAKLDGELDALMTLALSVLVWQTGRAPVWVLASGAMRYVFLAASWVAPWVGAPLPPRFQRRAVCVIQVGSLILCLLPVLGPPATVGIAAFGLAALTWSFGSDVWWLWRNR